MTSTVASNVVALPGIGIGPHTPVRAADSGAKAANTEANGQGGQRGYAAQNAPEQPPANNNTSPSRPNSPVAPGGFIVGLT